MLVGDGQQLAAVGRGGMIDHLVDTHPDAVYRLGMVQRFVEPWEKTASLELRRGSVDVLDTYAAHDRFRSATDIDDAVRHADSKSSRSSRRIARIDRVTGPTRPDSPSIASSLKQGISGWFTAHDATTSSVGQVSVVVTAATNETVTAALNIWYSNGTFTPRGP